MKANLSFILVAICLTFASSDAAAQEEKGETLHGVIESVDGYTMKRELVALKSNPYYFGSDIYAPKSIGQGGPFTIGCVIHSNRHATLSAWIGGVAVFDRAVSDDEMKRLATIGNCSVAAQESVKEWAIKGSMNGKRP